MSNSPTRVSLPPLLHASSLAAWELTTHRVRRADDVGFLSWPAQAELALVGTNETARNAVLQMAGHLADRYDPLVGCTKSWDVGGPDDFEVVRPPLCRGLGSRFVATRSVS